MKSKIKNSKINSQDKTSDNNYFEFLSLFFIIGFLLIDFIPQFKSIEIIGPQYLYLSLLNITIGLFAYFNPTLLTQNLISIVKNNHAIKAYSIFIIFCGASIFFAKNQSLAVVSFIRLFIIFVTFVNLSILLNNRLHLIYKIIFLFGISVFIQSFVELYYFVQSAKANSILDALAGLKGNTGNINIFSANLSVKTPFILIGIFHFTKWKKWFLTTTLLLSILLIFMSGSRAAFLSLFIEFIIFIILYLKINSISKKRVLSLSYLIVPLVISFFISNLIFQKGKDTGRYKSVASRVTQITNVEDASVNARLDFWKTALTMIKEQPIVGIGLGNWKVESIPFEKAIGDDHTISSNTHNDFLEISAETGILNGIIYLSIFIFCLYSNIKTIFKSDNVQTRTIALLSLLLIVSYGIDAFFNFPFYRPTMQLGFCFFLALTLINTANVNESQQSFLTNKAAIFIIAISIITSYFSYQTFKAYRLENDIKANFAIDKFTLTTNEIISKLPKYPNVLVTAEPYATYVGKYFIEEGKFDQANKYLNIGNTINPYLGRTEFYKYVIAEKSEKKDSAFIYAKKALEIRPRNKTYYAAAINSAIALNDTTGIIEVHNLYIQYKNHPEIWINTSSALNQSNYGNKKLIDFVDKGLNYFPKDSLLLERKKLFENNSILQKSQPFILQATTFYNNQKYENAIESYKKALNLDPQNYVLLQNIGLCHYNLKQYFDAISFFNKSLNSSNLQDGKTQYFLGMSYFFVKDKENGCKYIKLAKDKNYGNAQDVYSQQCN